MENKNLLPFVLSENLASTLSDRESDHIDKIADEITKKDPKLTTADYFGPNVHLGYSEGPVLFTKITDLSLYRVLVHLAIINTVFCCSLAKKISYL